jgi:AraC-like DNA-binding protein
LRVKITLVESRDPNLSPWLIGYLGSEIAPGNDPVRRVIPARPNSFVQIILAGDHTLIDVETGLRSDVPAVALFGPLPHYRYDLEVPGQLRTFSIRLQPAAAGQLFGLEPVSLIDSYVPIDLPAGLFAGLAAAPDWAAMAALVDDWLGGLAQGKPGEDPVAAAASELRERHGQAGIHELADAAGVSLRQFQRRFRLLTGLSPKLYARICRISHAVHRKQLSPEMAWTALAQDAGYSDQSHFIRDFKALTGVLPKNFLRGQTPIERHPRWRD